MRLMQLSFVMAMAVCVSAVASNQPRLSASGPVDRSPVERISDYPSGVWVTEEYDEKVLRISRRGHVSTNVQLVLPNGMKKSLNFPGRLREGRRGRYYARGEVTVGWVTSLGVLNCRYPVNLDVYHRGDELEAELEYPSQVGIDGFGRCFHLGRRTEVLDFVRDNY